MPRKYFTVIPAVFIILQDKAGKVLLIRRANTGYQDGNYAFPGGHIEGGEPAVIAAIREVKEEVGVMVKESDMKLVHTVHAKSQTDDTERINLVFETDTWQGTIQNMEPDKCDDVDWFDTAKLPTNLESNAAQILKQIPEKTYSHIRFADFE